MPLSPPFLSEQEVLNRGFDAVANGIRQAPLSGAVAAQSITVGTSAVALPTTALTARKVLMVRPPVDMYVGASGVTTANGFLVAANTTATFEIGPEITLYGVCGTASNAVKILEIS